MQQLLGSSFLCSWAMFLCALLLSSLHSAVLLTASTKLHIDGHVVVYMVRYSCLYEIPLRLWHTGDFLQTPECARCGLRYAYDLQSLQGCSRGWLSLWWLIWTVNNLICQVWPLCFCQASPVYSCVPPTTTMLRSAVAEAPWLQLLEQVRGYRVQPDEH
jgi:hypothetical protein